MGLRVFLLTNLPCFSGYASAAPIVSNLTAVQRRGTQLVDLTYDLHGGGFGSLEVTVDLHSPDQGYGHDAGANAMIIIEILLWDVRIETPSRQNS